MSEIRINAGIDDEIRSAHSSHGNPTPQPVDTTVVDEEHDSVNIDVKSTVASRPYNAYADLLVREHSGNSLPISEISSTSTRIRDSAPTSESQFKGSFLLHPSRNKVGATPPRTPPRDCYVTYQEDLCMSVSPGSTPEVTRSSDVKLYMDKNGKANVVTAEPAATGPPDGKPTKAKPKLTRRKSLNPRMVTPPGLEVLENTGMVAIRQQMENDIIAGCGASNTYKIKSMDDEQIFYAAEDSSCVCRWACGPNRRFSIDLFSNNDDPVLNFRRFSCRCDCCCCLDCFLCLQKLYVVDCLGRTIGAVKQKFSIFNVKFDIVDHDSNPLFKVVGPSCPWRCCTEIYFPIFNKTGERQIGRIQKKWGGDGVNNVNVDHEYFDVTFPERFDPVDKALIIGAAFLINVMFLEMS